MFNRDRKAKPDMMFRLPFGSGTLSFADIQGTYKDFVDAMDGMDMSSCLCFYYEKNPVTSIYEFRDNDAEADVADAMGIDFGVCSEGESLTDSQERKHKEKQKELMQRRKEENSQAKLIQNLWACYQRASGVKKDAALNRLSTTFLAVCDTESIPDDISTNIKIVISSRNTAVTKLM